MDIVVHKNIAVPMRDGVILAADLYRPAVGGPFPTLLARTPYSKDFLSTLVLLMPDPLRLAQAGYAVLVQDCRGCYQSDGQLNPFFHEAHDGLDTIAWAAAQPWADGAVGMLGGSYLGIAQWLAAAAQPPALRAIAPFITSDQLYQPWIYQGGAFQLGFCLFWALGYFTIPELHRRIAARTASLSDLGAATRALGEIATLYWHLPLSQPPAIQATALFYSDWLAHPSNDDYWRAIAPAQAYARITTPALIIAGWYDPFLAGSLASYQSMRDHSGSPAARHPQLIIGPWSHGVWHGAFAERDFGPLAGVDALDLTTIQLRWFDYWLKHQEPGPDADLPVKLFVMGADQWREEQDWPLPDTQYRRLYLHSGGKANTLHGDGVLSWDPPGAQPPDQYRYDPRDPTPTCGGATLLPGALTAVNAGPRDQRAVEARADVLVYSTPPLSADLELIGPLTLRLYVASSARDTDFCAKLIDVYPDGRALILSDGILRARYRASQAQPQLLAAGQVYALDIDLVATANRFKVGHRIRLELASSNFPRFDRNSNTGGLIAYEHEADFVVAVNQIFHDAQRPSHLIVPLVEG